MQLRCAWSSKLWDSSGKGPIASLPAMHVSDGQRVCVLAKCHHLKIVHLWKQTLKLCLCLELQELWQKFEGVAWDCKLHLPQLHKECPCLGLSVMRTYSRGEHNKLNCQPCSQVTEGNGCQSSSVPAANSVTVAPLAQNITECWNINKHASQGCILSMQVWLT